MPLSGRVFLIAGATSGIGLALSREVIRRGAHVFGIGRRLNTPWKGSRAMSRSRWTSKKSHRLSHCGDWLHKIQGSRMSYVRLAVGLEQLATSNS